MKVLVTGNKGYIRSVLAWGLIDRSYEAGGYDTGYYGDFLLCSWPENYGHIDLPDNVVQLM